MLDLEPFFKVVPYYTIMLNGYYLDKDIWLMCICNIPYHMTKNIGDIPDELLFEDYEKAYDYLHNLWEQHYLMRLRKDKLEVVPVWVIRRNERSELL